MGLAHSPRIATDGLVFALDAANRKSFDPRENLYPHSETLQTLGDARCSREVFTSGGPLGRGYVEFTATETSSFVYNFDSGNTISLTAGDIITFSILFQNVDVSGSINLRCWGGSGRAWSTTRQVTYNLANLTSSPSSGTILDHFITSEGNGWYRLSMTVQADLTGFSAISTIFTATIGEKYRVTAVQVETGEYHNGYLQTDGTAITRSNTVNDLNKGTSSVSATTVFTTIDDTAGTVLDHNNSSAITSTFSSPVDHESWSLMCWIKSTGLTSSNYRTVLRLIGDNAPYFYLLDTRQTTNSYILGIQKDFVISSWLTYEFMNQSQWLAGGWWCLGISHNNKVFKHYTNGSLTNTQTQTRDVDGYGDLTSLSINTSGSNTVSMGPVLLYKGILSDDQFKQNFNAMKGRFGL